jgi:hypothetical protein
MVILIMANRYGWDLLGIFIGNRESKYVSYINNECSVLSAK